MDQVGLSPTEKDLMRERLLHKTSLAKLAKDSRFPPDTAEGVRKMEVRVLANMGYHGTTQNFFDQQKEIVKNKAREKRRQAGRGGRWRSQQAEEDRRATQEVG